MKPLAILALLGTLSACANHTDKISPCFDPKKSGTEITVSTMGKPFRDCQFRSLGAG